MEEILQRHRREKKDLQNKITGMKKQANKSQRKEVNSKCDLLQSDLVSKHNQEIESFNIDNADNNNNDDDNNDNIESLNELLLSQLSLDNKQGESTPQQPQPQQVPKKRRNRQREKLAKREQEIAQIKETARKEALLQPNLQKLEQDSIDLLCDTLKLKQVDIKPDGHCLFASILDQLKYRKNPLLIDDEYDVYKLRKLACQYINDHKDDFIPYLFDETTMQLQDIDEYINEMQNTAKWGGEIEIISLANIFDCPISILISGAATHKINESGTNPELKLVYYKHTYSLGEHYNSLHDLV